MVNERFIELLSKKLSGEIEENELEEFKLFLDDPSCREHYKLFKSYWVQNQEEYSNNEFLFQRIKNKIDIPENGPAAEIRRPFKFFTTWRKIAAVFFIGISASLCYYFINNSLKTGTVNALELAKTPDRVKSKIILDDGSVVTLNSATTLKYPETFSGKTREVYLDGEAFFDVAKDHKHPFIVHAGKMSIKVLGTAFNIKSYANDASSETTLLRGAIEVTLADRPSDRIILKPNEKLILKNATVKKYRPHNHLKVVTPDVVNTNYILTNLTRLKSNDTTIVETSWVNNKLIFKDEDFTVLANDMERWYGVKIKFKNNSYKDFHFTGIFERESIVQALDALKMIEPFNYKYKSKTVYIY